MDYTILDTYKDCLRDDWNKKHAYECSFEDYLIAKMYVYDVPSCFDRKYELLLGILLDKKDVV